MNFGTNSSVNKGEVEKMVEKHIDTWK